MSDPNLSETDFENKMALVWTTLNSHDQNFSVLIMSDNNCHVSWTDLLYQEEVLNSLPKSTIQVLEKLLSLDSLCKSPTR